MPETPQHLPIGLELGAVGDEETAEFQEIAAKLALAEPVQRPSPRLRERLLAAVGPMMSEPEPGVHVLRAGRASWKKTPFPGVQYKRLFVDRENRETLLLKLGPEARYPRHRHKDVEQCLVLSGDVRMGGHIRLFEGDFEWAEAETSHEYVSTDSGCTLLIVASRHDEILD